MNYYDAVLGLIPATFILGAGTAILLGSTIQSGIIGAAVISSMIVAHCMFVRSPSQSKDSQKTVRSHRLTTDD